MSDHAETVGALVGRCLAALGARRVFTASAAAIPADGVTVIAPRTDLGLDVHLVGDTEVATLLAAADGRLGPGPGVALLDGQRIVVTSAPGVPAEIVEVRDPAHVPGALAGWTLGTVHAAVEYRFELDLDAPAPAGLGPVTLDDTSEELITLSPTLADFRLLVVVGPGVVRSGHVAGLRALAERAGCGVLNTWGAKGVFGWEDPHHFGTVGLQARDGELSGMEEAELIITAGIDPLEAPAALSGGSTQVLEVEPWQLSSLAHHWPDPGAVPAKPPLFAALAAALGDRYRSDDVPLSPARATADLAATRPPGGLVLADPGPAGLWVARTFPTQELDSVVVPAAWVRGFAAAGALVAALGGRPAVAVTTDPLDAATEAVLALARAWEASLVLEIWGGDGRLDHAGDHAEQLAEALDRPGVERIDLPVDLAETRLLVDIAGEVVAWPR